MGPSIRICLIICWREGGPGKRRKKEIRFDFSQEGEKGRQSHHRLCSISSRKGRQGRKKLNLLSSTLRSQGGNEGKKTPFSPSKRVKMTSFLSSSFLSSHKSSSSGGYLKEQEKEKRGHLPLFPMLIILLPGVVEGKK